MTKRVLLISPYFPPHNTIGTKRAINFVQGVHGQEDWEVIVLASKPFKDEYDFRLGKCVPKGVIAYYHFVGIFRPLIRLFTQGLKNKRRNLDKQSIVKNAKKKKSISLTPFDQYVWDVRSAIHQGKKIVKKHKPDVIWVNADPWTGFLVGKKLSKKYNVPWVADLRDPWTVFEKKMKWRPSITVKIIRMYENRFFKSASKIVLNTETAYQAYKEKYPKFFSEKFSFIRNAFNQCLLEDYGIKPKIQPFTFGYYGGFRDLVPSGSILEGFADLIHKNNLSPRDVRFEVRGKVYPEFWFQVAQHKLEQFVNVESEVNLSRTMNLLRSWDVLLISAIEDRRWMIPAKFYDYLYARKPILAVSDSTELNELIEKTESGSWVKSDQSDQIFELFEKFYFNGKTDLINNESLIEPFGLKFQSREFLKVLDSALNN